MSWAWTCLQIRFLHSIRIQNSALNRSAFYHHKITASRTNIDRAIYLPIHLNHFFPDISSTCQEYVIGRWWCEMNQNDGLFPQIDQGYVLFKLASIYIQLVYSFSDRYFQYVEPNWTTWYISIDLGKRNLSRFCNIRVFETSNSRLGLRLNSEVT